VDEADQEEEEEEEGSVAEVIFRCRFRVIACVASSVAYELSRISGGRGGYTANAGPPDTVQGISA
jgi:hypothetical protein